MKTRSLLDLTTSLNLSRQVCSLNTCSSQVCRRLYTWSSSTQAWTPTTQSGLNNNNTLDSSGLQHSFPTSSARVKIHPKAKTSQKPPPIRRTPSQPPLTHGPPLARTTLRTDHLQRTDHPAHGPPKFTTPAHGPLPNPNFTKFNT
jgi:hypothetical protein